MKKIFISLGACILLSMVLWQSGIAQPPVAPDTGTSLTYAAGAITTYSVSGHVTYDDNSPISGVTISDNFGDSAVTDALGSFTINVPAGKVTITPTLSGLAFNPISITSTFLQDVTGITITGYPANTVSVIGGTIKTNDGTPLDNAQVSNSAGHAVLTDTNGYYEFSELPGAYTITPTEPGFVYTWMAAYLTVPPSQTSVNFVARQQAINLIFYDPKQDGFSFDNSFNQDNTDFTYDDLARLFGMSYVCEQVVNGSCVKLKQSALDWYNQTLKDVLGTGRCAGMAVASLRFYSRRDHPEDFQQGAQYAHDLLIENARRNISYYQVVQKTPLRQYLGNQTAGQTAKDAFGLLWNAFWNNNLDQYVLTVADMNGYTKQTGEAHVLVPYDLTFQDLHTWYIWVYDPSDHDNLVSTHKVIVDTAANTWQYDMGRDGVWKGNATSHGLYALQISPAYDPDQNGLCPWCPQDLPYIGYGYTLASASGANVLFTDGNGNQLGIVGGVITNTITGAFIQPSLTGGNTGSGFSYGLPVTGTYTVSLNGQTITQTQQADYWQFGPGYSFGVSREISPTTNDQASVSQNGKVVHYQANENGNVSLTLTSEAVQDASYGYNVDNLTLSAGQGITLTNDTAAETFALNNRDGTNDKTYDLTIHRVSSIGERIFSHPHVAIAAGDTEYLSYGTWDGQGDMTVEVDHGSDGSIDETVPLVNEQPQPLYLPLVIH